MAICALAPLFGLARTVVAHEVPETARDCYHTDPVDAWSGSWSLSGDVPNGSRRLALTMRDRVVTGVAVGDWPISLTGLAAGQRVTGTVQSPKGAGRFALSVDSTSFARVTARWVIAGHTHQLTGTRMGKPRSRTCVRVKTSTPKVIAKPGDSFAFDVTVLAVGPTVAFNPPPLRVVVSNVPRGVESYHLEVETSSGAHCRKHPWGFDCPLPPLGPGVSPTFRVTGMMPAAPPHPSVYVYPTVANEGTYQQVIAVGRGTFVALPN